MFPLRNTRSTIPARGHEIGGHVLSSTSGGGLFASIVSQTLVELSFLQQMFQGKIPFGLAYHGAIFVYSNG